MDTIFAKHIKSYKIGLQAVCMERCKIVYLNGVSHKKLLQGALTPSRSEKIRILPRSEFKIKFSDYEKFGIKSRYHLMIKYIEKNEERFKINEKKDQYGNPVNESPLN